MQQLDIFEAQHLALEGAKQAAQRAYEDGVSENTQRTRKGQMASFLKWLQDMGYSTNEAPSTEIVLLHVGWMLSEQYSRSSIDQRINTIRWLCASRGWADPTDCAQYRQVWRGVCRQTKPPQGRAALTDAELRQALAAGTFSARERAILLVGCVTGLRVSELCGLLWRHVEFCPDGAIITIERSKTDQEQLGQQVFVPHTGGDNCPLRALQSILRAGSMFPVFGMELADPRQVRLLMKRVAVLAGKDPSKVSAHSLRKSAATIAHRKQVATTNIRDALRHTKLETTEGYIAQDIVQKNPTSHAIAKALG